MFFSIYLLKFKIYLILQKPFKPHLTHKDSLMCILCEKLRGKVGDNKCHCVSVTQCKFCDQDDL